MNVLGDRPMVRNAALWMLFCVPMYWQVPAGADEAKTADEVIAKYIEAIGGREKIDAVKSMKTMPLLTTQEGVDAMRKAGSTGYHPPA